MSNVIPGGWSTFSCDISPEAMKAFEKALEDIIGVDYTPVAVATQIVAGTNYAFFCNGQVVAPDTPNEAFLIRIFVSLSGEAELVNIEKVHGT